MAAEMAEQPAILEGLAKRRHDLVAQLKTVVPEALAGIVLFARGSSDHAAIYGRYVFEVVSGRPVALGAPSLHTVYEAEVDYGGYLAVGISQSGQTPEIVSVLERAGDAGAKAVAVTNDAGSALAEVADVTVELGAGEERAIPATKTFTAQLAAMAIVAEALGDVPWEPGDWERLPDLVRGVLGDSERAQHVAEKIGDAPGLITVGRGFVYPIALEAALKLKETTGILAEGYSAADLRHGPIAVIAQGFPVLAFSARGPAAGGISDLARLLRGRGARVVEVGNDGTPELPVPRGAPEALIPVPMVVRAQQVAHALALHRELDPDNPPGLSKITSTS